MNIGNVVFEFGVDMSYDKCGENGEKCSGTKDVFTNVMKNNVLVMKRQ